MVGLEDIPWAPSQGDENRTVAKRPWLKDGVKCFRNGSLDERNERMGDQGVEMRNKVRVPRHISGAGFILHAKILESACRSWLCTATHVRSPSKPQATRHRLTQPIVSWSWATRSMWSQSSPFRCFLSPSSCPFVLSPTYPSCAYRALIHFSPPLRPYTFPLFNPLPLLLGVLSRPRLQQAPDFGSPC